MRFIHQGRRDIPGYRVDLSRRRERERERGGEKKREWKKNNERSPSPSLWSGGRSRPSFKVFESSPSRSLDSGLERPISLDAGLFALAAVPLARAPFEGPGTRVLERRTGGFQRVYYYLVPSNNRKTEGY